MNTDPASYILFHPVWCPLKISGGPFFLQREAVNVRLHLVLVHPVYSVGFLGDFRVQEASSRTCIVRFTMRCQG